MKQFDTGLMWFRRDLRTADNTALAAALQSCKALHCAFVLDSDILAPLPRADRRVEFIVRSLEDLDAQLRRLAGGRPDCGLIVRHGPALPEIVQLAQALHAQAVFAAHDDEPASLARDGKVRATLADRAIALHTFKDHVVFERQEILTQNGTPYSVFTPYKKAWLAKAQQLAPLPNHDPTPHADALAPRPEPYRQPPPSLEDIGFTPTNLAALKIPCGSQGGHAALADFLVRIDHYHDTRDYPAVKGPSYLGVHLRFGTLSIRRLAALALERAHQGSPGAASWLSELVWREFYAQILANFPQVGQGQSFRRGYDRIRWEHGAHGKKLFAAWCEGRTGYPLVDAAMAQLNQSGYMHNRLRMVAGSFLVKHLGVDWRWGEAYFATHLNDFELASNNGGWQWVASSGCDAQPYFRIFNPVSQSEKFDPQGKFIRRYLPQLAQLPDAAVHAPWLASPLELAASGVELGKTYPRPIVDHAEARAATLARYAVVKQEK
jgi:deoxyribodipyrimidine photo-lyase